VTNQVGVIFEYAVSDKFRNAETIATGQRLPAQRQLRVSLADLTPGQRQTIIEATEVSASAESGHKVAAFSRAGNEIVVNLGSKAEPNAQGISYGLYASQVGVERDEELTPETAVLATNSHARTLARVIAFSESLLAEKLEAWQECADLFVSDEAAAVAKAEAAGIMDWYPPNNRSTIGHMHRMAESKRRKEIEERNKARREAEAKRRDEDKAAWIAEHGSAHLREAFGRGYDSQRQYVLERARLEAPGWTLDFNESSDWNNRSFPSVEALRVEDEAAALAEKLGARSVGIVWLTKPATSGHDSDEEVWDFEQCEAVAIREYMGQYDLVKMIA
jgi:hypothetical protein